jgi:sugar lactone lactonase YvrE
MDFAGNLYIADLGNHVVRKVTPLGNITTIAGTGAPGYNGDDQLATNAQLAAPAGVAVDASGFNLYIVDNGNHRIRQVDLMTLTISTIAGTGERGFSGDGGVATQARLNYPAGVALDQFGNLYIADSQNRRIRRVDPNGIITTVAGSGQRGSSGDNGLATFASFKGPVAVAVGPNGDLFIADNEDHRVRRVNPSGIITTVAGNGGFFMPTPGPATQSSVRWPQGLTTDAGGNLYIADNTSHVVLQVSPAGMLTIVAGTGTPGFNGDNIPANQAVLNGPSGLVKDRLGNLYISETLGCRVRRVSS